MKTGKDFCERHQALKSERQPFETGWREVTTFMRPMRDEFKRLLNGREDPETLDPLVSDSTAMVALDNFQGGIFGHMTNPANEWCRIKTFDEDLNEYQSVKEWLAIVSRRMLKSFGPAVSSFYSQVPELYADTPAYGTGAFFSEMRHGAGPRFFDSTRSIYEICIDLNDYDEVDTVYREFVWSARQIVMRFGEQASAKVREKAEKKPGEMLPMLHVVTPNTRFDAGKIGIEGFAFVDLYIEVEDKHIARTRGRRTLPFNVPRWEGAKKYGFGLGRRALPDTKMINSMDNSILEAAEWQTHPTVLLPDEDRLGIVRPVPRGIAYGGIDPQGRRLVDFASPTGNLPFTFEMMQRRREDLRDAWFFSLMQLVGRTGMNPIEVLQHQEERMRLMGPNLARLQSEFLAPMIRRRYQLLTLAGALPPPPPEVEGAQLEIEYSSPMAQAQKFAKARSTLQAIEGLGVTAQLKPETLDLVDGDTAARHIVDGFGAPADILLAPEEVEGLRRQRANQMALQQALQTGVQGADIADKLGLTARNANAA